MGPFERDASTKTATTKPSPTKTATKPNPFV